MSVNRNSVLEGGKKGLWSHTKNTKATSADSEAEKPEQFPREHVNIPNRFRTVDVPT